MAVWYSTDKTSYATLIATKQALQRNMDELLFSFRRVYTLINYNYANRATAYGIDDDTSAYIFTGNAMRDVSVMAEDVGGVVQNGYSSLVRAGLIAQLVMMRLYLDHNTVTGLPVEDTPRNMDYYVAQDYEWPWDITPFDDTVAAIPAEEKPLNTYSVALANLQNIEKKLLKLTGLITTMHERYLQLVDVEPFETTKALLNEMSDGLLFDGTSAGAAYRLREDLVEDLRSLRLRYINYK